MRTLPALLLCILLTAATAPARDWRATVGVAPSGGFVTGNPAAKVTLVEYLSFTCPHCAHFVADSKPVLHDLMVRDGSVRVETRSAARDPYDLAAWLVARCGGPRRFAALSTAIFAGQDAWTQKGSSYVQANLEAVRAMPQRQQLRTLITESGLGAIASTHGLAPAALTACLATDATLKPILTMTDAAFAKIQGTPGFEVNGELVTGADWPTLEPRLRAVGAH